MGFRLRCRPLDSSRLRSMTAVRFEGRVFVNSFARFVPFRPLLPLVASSTLRSPIARPTASSKKQMAQVISEATPQDVGTAQILLRDQLLRAGVIMS